METWALDLTKQIQWKFLIDVADHEAAEAIPALDHHRGIEVKQLAPGEDHTSFAFQQMDCSRPLRAGHYWLEHPGERSAGMHKGSTCEGFGPQSCW